MVRETILEGAPILREVMPDINNPSLAASIIRDLIDTMFATDAIGFAANQINEPWNICIVRKNITATQDKGVLTFINPKIVSRMGSLLSTEGCKSLPDYGDVIVPRARKIMVAHNVGNKTGIATLIGMTSFIAQHEIDHLRGILIKDYVEETNGKSGGVRVE